MELLGFLGLLLGLWLAVRSEEKAEAEYQAGISAYTSKMREIHGEPEAKHDD